MEIKKLHTFQAKMLICSILIFILSLIVLFTKIPGVILLPFIIICGIYFFRYLDLYFNLEKHEKSIYKLIKYPLFIDNRMWLNHDKDDYKELFNALKKYSKKYKTKLILLKLQLDEIEQIKHKTPEDEKEFNEAKKAIDFIELLQKDKVLTIRGLGLSRIKKIEGDENSDDDIPQIKQKDINDPLNIDGAEYKEPKLEGRYKSKLAEGIRNLLESGSTDKLEQINLISETPEIRVRVRAYGELINNLKVEVVDLKKAITSAKYINKYAPKTFEEKYKDSNIGKKQKELKKKNKERKEKLDFFTKDVI